jgi:hypothetical protein
MIDETEQRKGASAAVDKDLPFDPAWLGLIETAYPENLEKNAKLPNDAELHKLFVGDLPSLTNKQGLFINILMQGRAQLIGGYLYRTIFEKMSASGSTDRPLAKNPHVKFNQNLADPSNGSLPATMIHEYTHLATVNVYNNNGDPWNNTDKEAVILKLKKTYPVVNNRDGYVNWKNWLATLDNKDLVTQINGVLAGYESYSFDDWPAEALPHVVEIIYYLYRAGVNWWTITESPIKDVADLLAKFAYTATN